MTTYNHTDIATGAAATAAVINAPLGQLDAAIGNLTTLTTASTSSVVAALNTIGNVSALGAGTNPNTATVVTFLGTAALRTTQQKVVPAINELLDDTDEIEAEILAARGGYSSVDARLDSLVAAGGNVATLTNGAASAGQKNVTVDSTVGFIAGAYVAYALAGGDIEYNLIASITPTTVLVLTTNIGTGGIANDTYISMISPSEYAAANAIPHADALTLAEAMVYANHGVHNVMAYGATGDGTTDDHTALEAAWTALADGDTLVLPNGTYAVSNTVDWTGKDNITIIGHNATIKPQAASNFSTKAVVDMADSGYCRVVGLRWDCDLSSYKPSAALVLARDGGVPGGGANYFDNCWFSGDYAFAVVYAIGSELTTFVHCRFLTNDGGIPCFYTSDTDDASLAEATTSNVCMRFLDCTFLDYSGASSGQVLIEVHGVTKELVFRDCYAYLGGGGNVIALLGTGASMYGMVIDNMRVEGVDHADSRLLYIDQDNATSNCWIGNITWTITSDFVIEVAGSSLLRFSVLWLLYPLANTTAWMQVSNNISFNYMVVGNHIDGSAGTISIDSGDTAYANYVVSFGSGSPFAGSGISDQPAQQDNIVAAIYTQATELGYPRRRTEYLTLDTGATPSVAKRDLVLLSYSAPTTITDFTGHVDGQELTLVTTNANATIDHGSNIALNGSADWTMPSGATLTLRDLSGVWYEVARMDPS